MAIVSARQLFSSNYILSFKFQIQKHSIESSVYKRCAKFDFKLIISIFKRLSLTQSFVLHADVLYNGLSQSSSSIRSTPQIKAKTSPFGPRPKSARVISKTKQPWTSGRLQASTPRSTHTESGNSFDYPAGNQSKPGTKVQNIDGSCLESREQTAASSSLKDDDKDDDDGNCVLCQTGVIHGKGSTPAWSRTQRRNSSPARLWSGKKGQTLKRGTEDGGPEGKTDTTGEMREESTESKVSKEVKQMVLQQYHLRIFGKTIIPHIL